MLTSFRLMEALAFSNKRIMVSSWLASCFPSYVTASKVVVRVAETTLVNKWNNLCRTASFRTAILQKLPLSEQTGLGIRNLFGFFSYEAHESCNNQFSTWSSLPWGAHCVWRVSPLTMRDSRRGVQVENYSQNPGLYSSLRIEAEDKKCNWNQFTLDIVLKFHRLFTLNYVNIF